MCILNRVEDEIVRIYNRKFNSRFKVYRTKLFQLKLSRNFINQARILIPMGMHEINTQKPPTLIFFLTDEHNCLPSYKLDSNHIKILIDHFIIPKESHASTLNRETPHQIQFSKDG